MSVTDPHPGPNAPPLALQAGASPSANEVVAFARDHQVGLVDLKLTDLPRTQVPTSLDRVLETLDADHEFLLAGEVFTSDLIDAYLEHKRSDVHELRLRPHSWEFALYFDA